MLVVTLAEAAQAMAATSSSDSEEALLRNFPSVSIDTRTLRPGEAYFAIRGLRLDGHQFIPDAIAAGASVVVSQLPPKDAPADCLWLQVSDTIRALQLLAQHVRQKWARPVIAITGSIGKTTTRRFIGHLLSKRFQVGETPGNFNNHLGVPLSLLALDPNHELAVLELGMNHAGEIGELARICRPTAGMITNVAPVHTEFLPSLDDVADAKAELIDHLPEDGYLFYNGDDSRVERIASRFPGRRISFGFRHGLDYRVAAAEIRGFFHTALRIEADGLNLDAEIPLVGRPFLYSAAAAVAVAARFGVEPDQMREALASAAPASRRGQVFRVGELTLYDDTYNSSPKAVEALLETLAEVAERRRCVLVLGDMLELGDRSADFHTEIGRRVADLNPAQLVTVGIESRRIGEAAAAAGYAQVDHRHFEDSSAAADYLVGAVRPGDFVAVKGSRGIHMETIVERLKEEGA
jgi:UDP-N-acetylmuramoyl-tripeptide--D-alanyl-D-alanine ligase